MPMNIVLDRVREWKGRAIAYGGGSGVSLYSADTMAKAQSTPPVTDILHAYLLPGVTVGSALTLFGAALVLVRLVFDIWKYFDERQYRKASKDAH